MIYLLKIIIKREKKMLFLFKFLNENFLLGFLYIYKFI